MLEGMKVFVIMPALNEADSIGKVLGDIPHWVDEVVVVDNGSTDATAAVASEHGARAVREDRRGYGRACLSGIAAIDWCDVVVFLDADYSDYPQEMDRLVAPIARGQADMVIGSRTRGSHSKNCFSLPQRFGNILACHLIRLLWRFRFTDLGPFRAIRWSSLRALQMQDLSYGWTIEMQIKAPLAGMSVAEVPVSYRRRIGQSKISGTVRGVIGAGTKILGTIGRYAVRPPAVRVVRPDRLIVFTRYPVPGQTKTRLIPAIGPLAAAELHRRLVRETVAAARTWAHEARGEVEVNYCGARWRDMRRWLGSSLTYVPQCHGDLGQRMAKAFDRAFACGCRRVVLCGTDVPRQDADHYRKAFLALETHDVVLGPTLDGGYWLIGLRRPARIFDGIAWSTGSVLQQTMQAAERQGLSVKLLEPLTDLDYPEDLPGVEAAFTTERPFISVVIPALNEAGNIERAIRSARRDHVEIIVVDGGSGDDTAACASAAGAKVLSCRAGRAGQMNLGATASRGRVLLFLHTDTVLPDNYDQFIFSAMLDRQVVGGHYRCHTAGALTFGNRLVHLRPATLRGPSGDQAIFVRRSTFEAIGGFPDVPVAEDWFFMQKLKHLGNIATDASPVLNPSDFYEKWLSVKNAVSAVIPWCR